MSQTQNVGTHKTTIYNNGEHICIKYHNTDVVKFNEKEIILNSGGWETTSTKLRMNQASNQFGLNFIVYQRNYEWFVDFKNPLYNPNNNTSYWKEKPIDFVDNMVIERENHV